MELKIEEEQHH